MKILNFISSIYIIIQRLQIYSHVLIKVKIVNLFVKNLNLEQQVICLLDDYLNMKNF